MSNSNIKIKLSKTNIGKSYSNKSYNIFDDILFKDIKNFEDILDNDVKSPPLHLYDKNKSSKVTIHNFDIEINDKYK